MPIYLTLAYIVFCAVPAGMAISIIVRKHRVQKEIAALQGQENNRFDP